MSSTLELSPIFQSAEQAVHVAFLIMSQEAQQDSPTRLALIRALESIRFTDADQMEWLEQLRGESSGTVNFSGLSSGDIRAQCAMITLAVRTHLPQAETWVLQAKYGVTDFEDVNGRRRFAFSSERINAIKGLAEWLHASYDAISLMAMDCLVAKIYANHQRTEISYRDLAKSFGQSHMVYARIYPKLKSRLHDLERVAFNRLREHFIQQGIINEV